MTEEKKGKKERDFFFIYAAMRVQASGSSRWTHTLLYSGFIFSGLLDLSVGFVLSDTALFDAYMFLSFFCVLPS